MDVQQLQGYKNVLLAVADQQETISLLQAELVLQKERIDRQDKIIEQLSTKVQELEVLQSVSKKSDGEKTDDIDFNSIWKDAENLSIAGAVKETAEKALLANLGFVFDPNSKLYCNYSTGYYYDPGPELFYNGHTGVYYTYDADNQKFIFHSQVKLDQPATGGSRNKTDRVKASTRKKSTTKQSSVSTTPNGSSHNWDEDCDLEPRKVSMKKIKPKVTAKTIDEPAAAIELNIKENSAVVGEDMEEGEINCSDDDEGESCEESSNSEDDGSDVAYPPCIRAIVLESNSSAIKKGSLFLVTCMGGSIGSKGKGHSITLPDPSIDKHHATITYLLPGTEGDTDGDKVNKYFINDVGSFSGTFLNGTRLSEPGQPSEQHEVVHGSIVKVGGFSILLHIHPGSFTCGHCEPGLTMESTENSTSYVSEKPRSRNALMKQIKKKYGIERTLSPSNMPDAEVYTDRSHERRLIKGSDNPFEKTQVVTAEESISSTNKGFKMLTKMGWSTGKTLGNTGDQGLLEPIKLELKSDRAGLGMSGATSALVKVESCSSDHKKGKNSKKFHSIPKHHSRAEQLAITLKRFKETEVKMEVDVDTDGNLSTS